MALSPADIEQLKLSQTGGQGGMTMMRNIGTGVATEHKALSSEFCYFQILELFPLDQGELKSDTLTLSDTGVDAKGEAYQVSVKMGKSVKAKWLPDGTNRANPPDIRRGERAEIFRLADSDKYYWRSINMDQGNRRLETAMYLFSNTQDESVDKLTPENSWMMEVSTHQKTFSFSTPKSDGETHGYNMQLNTKESTFTLRDDAGQALDLDSKAKTWKVANGDNSSFEMAGPNLSIDIGGKLSIKCGAMDVNVAALLKMLSQSRVDSAVSMQVTATSYNNQSANYAVTAGSYSMNYSQGSGTGAMDFYGTMKNNGVNVGSTHQHDQVQKGNGVSGQPIK